MVEHKTGTVKFRFCLEQAIWEINLVENPGFVGWVCELCVCVRAWLCARVPVCVCEVHCGWMPSAWWVTLTAMKSHYSSCKSKPTFLSPSDKPLTSSPWMLALHTLIHTPHKHTHTTHTLLNSHLISHRHLHRLRAAPQYCFNRLWKLHCICYQICMNLQCMHMYEAILILSFLYNLKALFKHTVCWYFSGYFLPVYISWSHSYVD